MGKNRWEKLEIGMIMLLIGISLTIAVTGIDYVQSKTVLEYYQRYMQDSTRHHTEAVDDTFQARKRFVENMASMIGYGDVVVTENLQEALSVVENNTYFDELYCIDEKGIRWYPDGSCQVMSSSRIYQNAMRGNSGVRHGVEYGADSEAYYFSFYAPIWKNGKTIGVLVGKNHYSNFNELHSAFVVTDGVSSYLISNRGDILLRQSDSEYETNLLHLLENKMSREDYQRLETNLQCGADGDFCFDDEAGKGIICLSSMDDGKLYIAQVYNGNVMKGIVKEANRIMYLSVSVIFVCTAIACLLMIHRVWIKYNKKNQLMNISLEAFGETIPRIAKLDLENNECVFAKDNEQEMVVASKKYNWNEFRENLLQSIHPQDREMAKSFMSQENIRRLWESGKDSDTCIYRREYKGEIQWMQTALVPIRRSPGERQMLMYARNVDDSVKSMELYKEQLLQALQQARRAGEESKEFLEYMSRDMRTPVETIGSIVVLMERAMELGDGETVKHLLKRIDGLGKYLAMVIEDIGRLRLTNPRKLSSKKGIISMASVVDYCRDVFDMFPGASIGTAEDREVTLSVIVEKEVQPEYVGDESRLQQALTAVLSNAYKFSHRREAVVLHISAEAVDEETDRLVLEVVDRGCGINESYLSRVCEPFTKENRISGQVNDGMGLGLYIAKLAVEAMEGSLHAESEEGIGSKFTICLELKHCSYLLGQSGRKLLVVDDNAMNLEIIEDMMRQTQYVTESCSSGREALEIFRGSNVCTFRAVLIDLKMPDMDGVCLANAIRTCGHPDSKQVLLIALTGKLEEKERKKLAEYGFDGSLEKPFSIDEFRELMRNCANQTFSFSNMR